jgi:nucleoside-diphosphate-sugar epimerase
MSKGLIFVTGATGFIGSQVLGLSLKAGYNVRLAVRKESQVEDLKKLFPANTSQMDFVVVPDLTKPSAFEGKLGGVGYIFHLASPMPGKGEDFKKEYLEPAVKGTASILEAAMAVSSIKRVTIMASILSIMPMGGLTIPNLAITGKYSVFNLFWPEGNRANREFR